jgi:hypothetical protein
MIHPLVKGEFRERVLVEKINELVDKVNALELALNNHYHMTIDSNTQSIGDYDKGFRSSVARLDEDV